MIEMKKTVLVVDDMPDDLAILKEILQADYRVLAATSGAAALPIARADPPPDLIILDVIMPGMDGFELCRAIKSDEAGAAIPVIFLTAKQMVRDESYAFDLGAADYIRKPIEPSVVLARVKAHLEQKDRLMRLSEMKYRRLFEAATDGILISDAKSGAIIDANPAMSAMLGLSHERFLNARISDIHQLRLIFDSRAGKASFEDGRVASFPAFEVSKAEGVAIELEASCASYLVNGRATRQWILKDVTELVRAERSRDDLSRKLSHYMATSPAITYSLKLDGGSARSEWVSDNITRILGYSIEEAMSDAWWFDHVHPDDRAEAVQAVAEVSKTGAYAHEYRFFRKDRSIVWLRDELRLIENETGGLEIVGTQTDISDLKSSIDEKSALLRELYHRVKNNMQVITSMLSLSADDPEGVGSIGSVVRRIEAMAAVHELFYESPDLARIDFGRFVQDQAIAMLAGEIGSRQGLDFDGTALMLGVDQAVPAGLVVSELIANAVRHAPSAPGRAGSLTIRVGVEKRDDPSGRATISIADDGPGLPEGFDHRSAKSLGMTLVSSLADQLRGSVRFTTGAGTIATFEFPIQANAAGEDSAAPEPRRAPEGGTPGGSD